MESGWLAHKNIKPTVIVSVGNKYSAGHHGDLKLAWATELTFCLPCRPTYYFKLLTQIARTTLTNKTFHGAGQVYFSPGDLPLNSIGSVANTKIFRMHTGSGHLEYATFLSLIK